MYLFIAIIFIAELIIACTVINFIVKADRKVRRYNACVETFNPLAQTCLQYSRCLVSTFNRSFENFFVFIKKKQEQIVFKTIVIIAIYSILFLFKIKADKASKFYKLAGVIRDIVTDLAV
ncbi:MAG TPA: hypothetical protein IAD11_04465 [Candidatus Stercorousia faecigallinarum]|nr:hypothetical protein [Candidatus Stercorousia faecigallinarum]